MIRTWGAFILLIISFISKDYTGVLICCMGVLILGYIYDLERKITKNNNHENP